MYLERYVVSVKQETEEKMKSYLDEMGDSYTELLEDADIEEVCTLLFYAFLWLL